MGLGTARELRVSTRHLGIDYFALLAVFLTGADLDLIADAALDARLTSPFFATGDDFIVRTTAMPESRLSAVRYPAKIPVGSLICSSAHGL